MGYWSKKRKIAEAEAKRRRQAEAKAKAEAKAEAKAKAKAKVKAEAKAEAEVAAKGKGEAVSVPELLTVETTSPGMATNSPSRTLHKFRNAIKADSLFRQLSSEATDKNTKTDEVCCVH